jgi:hypothetical protein
MVDPEDEELELDQLAKQILVSLEEIGGESNSRELRGELNGVKHSPFNYRLTTYLEPLGLVETHQPEAKPGDIPPKEITLTESGRDFLENIDGALGNGVEDRLAWAEEQIDMLKRENQELREKNRELEAALEQAGTTDIQGDLRNIKNRLDSMEDRIGKVEQDPAIQSNITSGLINAGVILGNTSKRLLIEELGEDRVLNIRDQVKAEMEEEGELIS